MNKSDPESLSDNEIISMLIDRKDRFWIGTTYGLNLLKGPYHNLDLSGDARPDIKFERIVAEHYDHNYLNNNEINCIFENFDGTIWLATQGGGINIFNPEIDSFSHITMKDNLPSNDVLGILRDEAGVLWMSTNNGLTTYNQYKDDPKIVTYRFQDGIQGNIFMVNSYYKSGSGEMYFGGDNGFTRFYPRNIKPNPIPPKLYLTNLKVYNERINIGDTLTRNVIFDRNLNYTSKITLPFAVKVFSIGVAPVHYQFPDGNVVAYKLEGYDKNWKWMMASDRFIEYSNLPFGKYNLLINGISSDNVQSTKLRQLAIEITPPWYREWYFVLLFVVMGLASVISFIYIAYNRQKMSYQKKLHDLSIESNESKMQFLTNIAHGLRTPLSLIIGPVEDMIQNYSDVSPQWKNHLFLIHRNSNYLLKLINQIIDFRKLNVGKLKLYKKDIDIALLVKEVGLNFKDMEGRQKVNLEFDLPTRPLIISVDPQKIEEVLYNLLSNAFKHTPHNKTIKLAVKSLTNLKGVDKVKISVFNEGSIIDEKDRQKIFERFYKTDENIEGAGIGLSFSKSLVEMHEGIIEAESIHEKGTVFHVYLPLDRNIQQKPASDILDKEETLRYEMEEEKILRDDNPNEEADKKLKILLVEDNEDLRGFLKNVLSRVYSCYEAENGDEGLKLVKEIMPDIVISDIIMPVMDGYELCKAIKDIPGTCHIPVILLTAKDSNEQIKSGYDVGADAYVTKPFDLGVIGAQISRLIKNRELIRKKYIDQNFMIEVNRSNLSKDDEFILKIRKFLESNISDPEYNVKELASSLNISSTQLYRKVKALTGYSPVEFIRLIKLQKAYELLVERSKSVKEVCFLSGFNNVSYFIKCFKDQFGITPAGLRDNPVEAEILDNNKELQ
jgi:signal transduction histidine kinase/DNA-binding response OmpR family regulator